MILISDTHLIVSTFSVIFFAELADKTFFTILVLATGNFPQAVFLGAAGAFFVQSLVAVSLGKLGSLLPFSIIRIGTALLFFGFAAHMGYQIRKEKKLAQLPPAELKIGNDSFKKKFINAFLLIFIAEWADITQLATAALVAKNHAPIPIFLSATLALWTVAGLAVFIGHKMKTRLNPIVIRKGATLAFITVGLWILLKSQS